MRFYQIDPTEDPRWPDFAEWHARGSVFHSVAWLKALQRTYGYEPVAFTTSPPTAELKNGIVFCHVKSWLTGHRLVSLPFSDHCEPLFDSLENLNFLIHYLQTETDREKWKYLEVRPIEENFGKPDYGIRFLSSANYLLHLIDLRPDLDEVFRNFDKDSVQRRVQRAEQAGLIEKCGTSDDLLNDFYRLHVITRGRHHVPPPPFAWFRNLVSFQRRALEIRVAYQDGTPIAAILTLRFRDIVYYKYGCSDTRFKNLGAMPWLLWNALVAAKSAGATEFDMGRTEEGNVGLLAFKNHWAPHPKRVVYWRYPGTSSVLDSAGGWRMRIVKQAFSYMPSTLLPIMGKVIYRHIG